MSQAVSPDGRYLLASIRSEPFSVMAWRIGENGGLTLIGKTPLPHSMAYRSGDRSGRHLLGASYGGDLISVNGVDPQGHVSAKPEQVVQTGKRAHAILVSPDNRFAFVSLLGADQMLQLKFDAASGQVTPNQPGFVNVEPRPLPGQGIPSSPPNFSLANAMFM